MKYNYGYKFHKAGSLSRVPLTDTKRIKTNLSLGSVIRTIATTYGSKLSSFSHFDSEKKICKLCYCECYSVLRGNGYYMMKNSQDNSDHRKWIRGKWYCSMPKKTGVEYE